MKMSEEQSVEQYIGSEIDRMNKVLKQAMVEGDEMSASAARFKIDELQSELAHYRAE